MLLLNGFTNLKDVVNERVVGDLIPTVTTAVDQSIAEHNRVTEAMMGLFVHRTTKGKFRYKSPVAAKLQPLDEHGRARKIKAAGYYDLGLPLRDAGAALGDTRIALVKKTVKEVNDEIAMLLDADKRWLRDQILAALFANAEYTFADAEIGDVVVKPLANNDSQIYLVRAGAEGGETANHFRAVTAMNDANQPFHTIYRDLTKRPENAGDGKIISMISGNLEANVMGLTNFIEATDPDIQLGVNTSKLTGSLNVPVPGEVIGKVDRNWIVRWDSLPDNYVISVTTSGDRPVAMREHAETELQGFNRVAQRNDDPYYESQFTRHAGFGAYNRVGAIVTKVDGDGTYDVPTDLAQPMI
jgi:hypothetical protein